MTQWPSKTIIIFRRGVINKDYLKPSDKHTTCPWKGEASYYTLEVVGEKNEDAAWYYPEPKETAQNIKNKVAFWKGLR